MREPQNIVEAGQLFVGPVARSVNLVLGNTSSTWSIISIMSEDNTI